MGTALRILVYVVAGGAFLTWANPRNGLAEGVLILAWLGVCIAVDRVVDAARMGGRSRGTPRPGPRQSARQRFGRHSTGIVERGEHRTLRSLHATQVLEEAEAVLAKLRERKLHPILVAHRNAAAGESIQYQVRLPEAEVTRAQAVLARFSARRAES